MVDPSARSYSTVVVVRGQLPSTTLPSIVLDLDETGDDDRVSGRRHGVAAGPVSRRSTGSGTTAAIDAGVDANDGASIATDAGIGRQAATSTTNASVAILGRGIGAGSPLRLGFGSAETPGARRVTCDDA